MNLRATKIQVILRMLVEALVATIPTTNGRSIFTDTGKCSTEMAKKNPPSVRRGQALKASLRQNGKAVTASSMWPEHRHRRQQTRSETEKGRANSTNKLR